MQGEKLKQQQMKEEQVKNYSFEFIGGNDVMPIVGYYGPVLFDEAWKKDDVDFEFPNRFTDEFFQLIAGSGLNIIGKCDVNYAEHPDLVKEALKLGEKNKLGILVNDYRLTGSEGRTMTVEEVAACIAEYADYPSYIGNYIVDEPTHKEYWYPEGEEERRIEMYFPIFQKLCELGIHGYGNLLPNWMHADGEVYKKYLTEFVENCKVPYLSYDMYPFEVDSMEYVPRYFRNLTQIREVAEAAGIPFWTYVQAGANFGGGIEPFDVENYFPSQGQFFWNVGTQLAFGTKGIQYFPLIQPVWYAWAESTPYDFERNGLIGADGRTTRWYAYAKAMNAQIAAADEVLMNAVNKGIIVTCDEAREHVGDSQYIMEGTSWRELVGVDGKAMIGCFNYKGKTALYVVNYDVENPQTITLHLEGACNMTVVKDAEKSNTIGSHLTLDFSAGNSALVVFQ